MTEDRTPTEGRADLIDRGALRKSVKAHAARFGDVNLIDMLNVLDAAPAAEPVPLTLDALTAVFRVSPISWPVRRPDGAWVMTRMFESADEAAAFILAALASPDKGEPRSARDPESPAP